MINGFLTCTKPKTTKNTYIPSHMSVKNMLSASHDLLSIFLIASDSPFLALESDTCGLEFACLRVSICTLELFPIFPVVGATIASNVFRHLMLEIASCNLLLPSTASLITCDPFLTHTVLVGTAQSATLLAAIKRGDWSGRVSMFLFISRRGLSRGGETSAVSCSGDRSLSNSESI